MAKQSFQAAKVRGIRSAKRGLYKVTGEPLGDLLLKQLKEVGSKKLKEFVDKTGKKLRGKLHQGVEQAGQYVGKKISENVKSAALANVLQKGAKGLKKLVHKGVDQGGESITKYAAQEIDKFGNLIAPKPKVIGKEKKKQMLEESARRLNLALPPKY
jgi:poly-gamma-glutamate capsule biosynthesis protein CapA/YwtB (metallophosphatase superfamily)